jgi:hypothetical protein
VYILHCGSKFSLLTNIFIIQSCLIPSIFVVELVDNKTVKILLKMADVGDGYG